MVKLKSGETVVVEEIWGVARTWHKVRTKDSAIIYTMSDGIDSVIQRFSNKKRRWGK